MYVLIDILLDKWNDGLTSELVHVGNLLDG